MTIEYTGRNVDVTPALREHVAEKLAHAARALSGVIDAHVVLAVEKYRHIAEVVVRRRNGMLAGRAASRDMYRSIHEAIDRIERQVRRRREKVIAAKRRGQAAKSEAGQLDEERRRLPFAAPFPAVPAAPPRLVEEAMDRVKPIALEEAALLLEEASRPFVVFRNSASGRVAVLYRRVDGALGLVEPA